MPMRDYSQFLRLLAEKVYLARLANGQRVADTTDFNLWLTELADRAETADTPEQFLAQLN
jgi:hypothetical protein